MLRELLRLPPSDSMEQQVLSFTRNTLSRAVVHPTEGFTLPGSALWEQLVQQGPPRKQHPSGAGYSRARKVVSSKRPGADPCCKPRSVTDVRTKLQKARALRLRVKASQPRSLHRAAARANWSALRHNHGDSVSMCGDLRLGIARSSSPPMPAPADLEGEPAPVGGLVGPTASQQGSVPWDGQEMVLAPSGIEKAFTGTAADVVSTRNSTQEAERTDQPSHTLCLDWDNSSQTMLHRSLLTPGRCPRTNRAVWRVRLAAAVWSDGTPRRDSCVSILKHRVAILRADDSRVDRINVFNLLEVDPCELCHPDWPDWSGGIRVESGTAVAFETTQDHSTRILVVPYMSNDGDDPMAISMTQGRWTSPREGWGLQAAVSWPHAPQDVDSPSFDSVVLQRLRLAGIGEWAHYAYLKKHGLLTDTNSTPATFLIPTPESGAGYSPWMGSPFPPGPTGDHADTLLINGGFGPRFGVFPGCDNYIQQQSSREEGSGT